VAFFRPTELPIDPFGTPDVGFRSFRVTSPYGTRDDPLNPGRTVFHGGLDIGNARLGDRVIAIGHGTVIVAGRAPQPPWNWPVPAGAPKEWGPSYGGLMVVIEHPNGRFSQYAHLGSRNVAVGAKVSTTDLVGLVGESGSAFGRGHLHFGIRDLAKRNNGHDGFVDPWPLIQPKGIYEDPAVIAELKEDLRRCRARLAAVTARKDALLAQADELEAQIAALEPLAAQVPDLEAKIRQLRLATHRLRAKVAELEAEE
jgi:murein DD-endopeptidase MepM/ murein hydrolase activator NlpD